MQPAAAWWGVLVLVLGVRAGERCPAEHAWRGPGLWRGPAIPQLRLGSVPEELCAATCTVRSTELIARRTPVVMRNFTARWGTSGLSWVEVLAQAGRDTLLGAKQRRGPGPFYEPSEAARMADRVQLEPEHWPANKSLAELAEGTFQYLGEPPAGLVQNLSWRGDPALYLSQEDEDEQLQSVWLSSAGVRTHLHFDSDFNAFVQLSGTKRWTLFGPEQYPLMCPFPRVHPLWAKAKTDLTAPDVTRCPGLDSASGLSVTVRPGDLLFVPPFWWHHVESETASLSLTTYSRHTNVYDHMHAVYRYEAEFDKTFENTAVNGYMLRFFLQLIIHKMYTDKPRPFWGAEIPDTRSFFEHMLKVRFSGLEGMFAPIEPLEMDWCTIELNGERTTPTSQHAIAALKFDVTVISDHFEDLPEQMRDVLFADYVEELVAEVAGPRKMLAYVAACFGATEIGYKYHNPDGFWQEAAEHSRGKRVAWPGHSLKGELRLMNTG